MKIAVVLLFAGVVATAVGAFTGCGSLFTWNGRHAIEAHPLDLGGGHVSHRLNPEPGRRYTLSIQVVFAREGMPKRDGTVVVESQLPLLVRVKDPTGTTLAEAVGWIDPNEPPNVLYGQSGEVNEKKSELEVERLIGPFIASSNAPLTIDVDLGADRLTSARIVERRLVIHDDTLPKLIKRAFIIAAVGVLMSVVGIVLIVSGWWKRRRTQRSASGSKRVGNRKKSVV